MNAMYDVDLYQLGVREGRRQMEAERDRLREALQALSEWKIAAEAERDAALAKLDQLSQEIARGEILCSSCAGGDQVPPAD